MQRKLVTFGAGLAGFLLAAHFLWASGPANTANRGAALAHAAVVATPTTSSAQADTLRPPDDIPLPTLLPASTGAGDAGPEGAAPVEAFTGKAAGVATPGPSRAVPDQQVARDGAPDSGPAVEPAQGAPLPTTAAPLPDPSPTATGAPVALAVAALAPARAPAAGLRAINGVPADNIVTMSDATCAHVRQIYAQGQALGRNGHAFSKVGDSTMAYPPLLADFDTPGGYQLGPYAYLQPAIAGLAGSFGRTSAAVKKNMHTWSEFDPAWVAIDSCKSGETPLACELRQNNPSIVIIRLGANDAFFPTEFEENMRKILDFWIANGVIPIVGTKPDRREGPQNTINGLVHKLAAEYGVPLWDYDTVAGTVPGKGLGPDQIHYVAGDTHDFSTPQAFQEGVPLEDLSALMALHAVRTALAPDN